MRNRLRSLGYDTELCVNPRDMDAVNKCMDAFAAKLCGATGVFFFAGHGCSRPRVQAARGEQTTAATNQRTTLTDAEEKAASLFVTMIILSLSALCKWLVDSLGEGEQPPPRPPPPPPFRSCGQRVRSTADMVKGRRVRLALDTPNRPNYIAAGHIGTLNESGDARPWVHWGSVMIDHPEVLMTCQLQSVPQRCRDTQKV